MTRHLPTEQAALEAWTKLRSTAVAESTPVETLQEKRKGCVYRLLGVGHGGSNVVAKWSSCERLRRESLAYEEVLPALSVSGVRYYGTLTGSDREGSWLFVEDAGDEVYSPVVREHRALAAHWLGHLHTSAAAANLACTARLPDRGDAYYLRELWSARDEIVRHVANPALNSSDVAVLNAVVRQCEIAASQWSEVQRICKLTPPTFIHGDFAPKNLRVERIGGVARLRPFDWHGAGWGVPAEDLAQLDVTPSYWANPDLDVYISTVTRSWPDVTREAVDRLAVTGKLFGSLTRIKQEATGLGTDWPEGAMKGMRLYKADMDDALSRAGWGVSRRPTT